MRSALQIFRKLIPQHPLQVGTVVHVGDGVAIIELPGGGRLVARGEAVLNQKVFVRDGAIEGAAADLPIALIEI